jgi:membrane peptidoglycan carboxypeptidase
VNDHRHREWPGDDQPRRAQWPADGDSARHDAPHSSGPQNNGPQHGGPQWPGEEPPRPPRHVQPPRRPQPPNGEFGQGEPRWPSADEPPRRPGGPAGDLGYGRRAAPPPGGFRPPQPPPPGRPPAGPGPQQIGPGQNRPPQGGPAQNRPPQDGGYRPVPPPPPRRYEPEDREPELLTHSHFDDPYSDTRYTDDRYSADPYSDDRYSDDPYDDDPYSEDWPEDELELREQGVDGDGEDDDADGKGKGAVLTPAQRKKRRWRRVRRTAYALVGLFVVLPAIAFTVAYFLVDVPSPEAVAADQNKVVTYYYANGEVMGKEIPKGGNRILLEPGQIPENVKHAVYAAEDATFETNNGFDVTGIMRAVWNQATGGVGGGSTISQQYVKKATGNDDATITRKALELVQSFKMNNEQSKSDIITAYLNTIYFGRGAYGIQTAAQAYYGKDVGELTTSEAALLAGVIQAPSRSDDPEYAKRRWNFVMDQLVANNWLPKAERDAAQFPKLIPEEESRPEAIRGPAAFIQNRVKAELEAKGYPEEKLQAGGYKIYTTIDPKAQQLAEQAVTEVMGDQPEELRKALVAVDPKTGGVRAYYGGPNDETDRRDWAATQRNPGSSFKVFDLVALLQQGKGLGETYDGSSPREFPGAVVRNSEGAECPNSRRCTVAKAMELSLNTVFYDMVINDTGVDAVKEAALAAGIPKNHGEESPTMKNPDGNISIGGGTTNVTPTDMASAYATFAAGGIEREEHFVSKLTTADDEVVFEVGDEGTPAFSDDPEKSKQIAGNVTMSLEPVLTHSDLTCADNRDCAGKTGTHQYVAPGGEASDENAQAWMVGYTPQISTAVWVGTGENEPIRTASGKRIYGSGLPGEIWQKFMNGYLEGKPREKFDEVEPIGKSVQEHQQEVEQERRRSQPPPPPVEPSDDEDSRTTTTTPPEETESSEESTPPTTESSSDDGDISPTKPGDIFPPGGPPDEGDRGGSEEDFAGWPGWNNGNSRQENAGQPAA